MPYDEGNKMTVGAWPRTRARVLAIAIAGALVGIGGSLEAQAQPQRRSESDAQPPRRNALHGQRQRVASAASATSVRASPMLEFEGQQRDGHLTPEERRLLRQHIEDAVRELYKR